MKNLIVILGAVMLGTNCAQASVIEKQFDTVDYLQISDYPPQVNIFDDIVFSCGLNCSTYYVEFLKPIRKHVPVKIGKVSKVKSDISLKISGLQQRLN